MSEKDNYGITKSLVERIKNALDMNLKTQIKKIFSSTTIKIFLKK